jgi:hypothetical protein
MWVWLWGRGLWDLGNLKQTHEKTQEHDRNAPIRVMALCGLVSATLSGQACLHKTSNSRICPLQSREYVNPGMQGAAQPVTGLHCKVGISKCRNWVNWRPWLWWGLLKFGLHLGCCYLAIWEAQISYRKPRVVCRDVMRDFSPTCSSKWKHTNL